MVLYARFVRTVQSCLLLYVLVSVVYTTNIVFVSPLSNCVSALMKHPWTGRSALSHTSQHLMTRNVLSGNPYRNNPLESMDLDDLLPGLSKPQVQWYSHEFSKKHSLENSAPILMDQDLFLSKAFSNSMRPSKIIPYFYRANGDYDREDITITTLITSNRFQVFSRLVERYEGPISVTIHVKNVTKDINDLLQSLKALYSSSQNMAKFVDVHLVVDHFDRQFNTWRNIARLFARTDFVMMLDIDFYPCTDFRSAVRDNPAIRDKLREGHAAFVVPAFEYIEYHEGKDFSRFPKDKQTLLSLVKKYRVGMFHSTWAPGHNSTDYPRFYAASPGEVYKVTQYQSAYEPYVIFKKYGPPWCDERFVGYGGNKAACLFEMYLSGISYYVLSDHFIIHQNHLYEESARKLERKYNRKLYADFKEETCLRYLKNYHDRGIWNTTHGANAYEECQKIKGFKKTSVQLLRTPRL